MSLVGFSARNHPQQVVCDEVDDRRTPRDLFDALNEQYRFTLDVAASAENRLCDRYFDKDTNGLVQPWAGERVWCNPPYSNLRAWLEKVWGEMDDGCELVVMVLPANRCEQGWWQEWVEPFRDTPFPNGIALRTRFLAGRLRFDRPGVEIPAKGNRPPFGCVVLTFTPVLTPPPPPE